MSVAYDLGFAVGAAVTADTFRAQVAELERLWLRAEADADHWYFEAHNPVEALARRKALASTVSVDIAVARREAATTS